MKLETWFHSKRRTMRTVLAFAGILFSAFVAGGQCPDPVSATCPPGFYMAEFNTGSHPFVEGEPIEIAVSGTTGSSPADFLSSTVYVEGYNVRIETWFYLGPWATPDYWEETFELPPLSEGSYSLEFLIWDEDSQEMVLNSITDLQVHAAIPVPDLGILGFALLAGSLALAGFRLLRS